MIRVQAMKAAIKEEPVDRSCQQRVDWGSHELHAVLPFLPRQQMPGLELTAKCSSLTGGL